MRTSKAGPEIAKRQLGEAEEPHGRNSLILFAIITIAVLIIAVAAVLASSNAGTLSSCAGKLLPQAKLSCYLYYAKSMRNVSLCNRLSGTQQYSCISAYALNFSDAAACSSITSNSSKASCVSAIGLEMSNASLCKPLDEPYKSSCAYAVAESANFSDIGACMIMGNSSKRASCDALYYYGMALKTENASYCALLPNGNSPAILGDVVAYGNNITSIANVAAYTFYNLSPSDYCFSKVAYASGNSSICDRLNGTGLNVCRSRFLTGGTQNLSGMVSEVQYSNLSTDLKNATSAAGIIYDAMVNNKPWACLNISQSGFAFTCILDTANHYNNSGYCSYLKNLTEQSSCYLSFNNSQ